MAITWAGAGWAAATAYVVADRVVNGGNVYRCSTAGVSAGAGGPTGTDLVNPVVDGTAAWIYQGPDGGTVIGIAPELGTVGALQQRTMLDEVARQIPVEVWGSMVDDGARHLAAHLATLTKLKGKGPVTAEATGQMSRSYASLLAFGMLGLSPYGVEYQRLIRLLPSVAFGEVF